VLPADTHPYTKTQYDSISSPPAVASLVKSFYQAWCYFRPFRQM